MPIVSPFRPPRGEARVVPPQIGIVLTATFLLTLIGVSSFLALWILALTDDLSLGELVATLPFGVQLSSWGTIGAAWMILFGISGIVFRIFLLADDTQTRNVLVSYSLYLAAFVGGFAWMYWIMDQPDSLLLSLKIVGGLDVVESATPGFVVLIVVIQRLLWEICWAVLVAGVFFALDDGRRRTLEKWERTHHRP